MNQLPAKYPFRVRAYETDAHNRLKVSSVFNFMQVAAGLNANELGFGYDHLTPKGYFWVLSRVILEWKGNVSFDEEIIVETWPKGVEKLFALRDFKFYDEPGACIGNATTAWLLMDSHKGRPMLLNKNMFNLPYASIPAAIDEVPGKITELTDTKLLYERKAVYSDIDVNQHVNNARYIEYIFDAIPMHKISPFRSCSIQVNYIKELKPGETVHMYGSKISDNLAQYIVTAENREKEKVFQSHLIFEPET